MQSAKCTNKLKCLDKMATQRATSSTILYTTEYKNLVGEAYAHIRRGHMSQLQRILKKVKLIEDVNMQMFDCASHVHTMIFNTILAMCIAADQMNLFTYVISQPEVNININMIATHRTSVDLPILCFAFKHRRGKYARLLLEHPSMLLLNETHKAGLLPMEFAIMNIPLDTKWIFSREQITMLVVTPYERDRIWMADELEERMRLIELMIEMGALIDNNIMTLIKRSPYKEKLLELTKRVWSSKSIGVKKRCNNCFNVDESLRKCSRCKLVYYCNISCQKSNRKHHKETCGSSQHAQKTKKRKVKERASRKCNKCGVQNVKLRLCGKCNSTYYCGNECRDADWKVHRLTH